MRGVLIANYLTTRYQEITVDVNISTLHSTVSEVSQGLV